MMNGKKLLCTTCLLATLPRTLPANLRQSIHAVCLRPLSSEAGVLAQPPSLDIVTPEPQARPPRRMPCTPFKIQLIVTLDIVVLSLCTVRETLEAKCGRDGKAVIAHIS